MVEGFHAADAALFVVDASGRIESGLEAAVKTGRSTSTAACFVINKCDRENADPVRVLDELRATFGNKVAPLHLAIGAGETFTGYVDLVHRKAYRLEGGKEIEIPIPAELADEVATRRDQLLEAASEADDDVFEKYLAEEEISDAELDACLHKGVRNSLLAPVLVASANKSIGLGALLDAIVRYLPSPEEEGPYAAADKAGKDVEVAADSPQLLVRVFKTAADPFVGRLTYLRVLSGTLKSQSTILNGSKGEDERIGQLLYLHGKEQEAAAELRAGEIGAVAKLGLTETGDTLTTRDAGYRLAPMAFPDPTLQVAIDPVSKADLDKMGTALQRMLEEEPCARVERSATGEQILRAIGEAHVAVIGERLKRKFGAAIATRVPRGAYRETIRGTTKVHGRYKKQTGGHGMFGDVWMELEPNPGQGVDFAEKVVGGSVPKNFFAGIEKGVRETAAEGVLAGYPLDDFRATLYDGSFHPVDSNELSFKLAASMAIKEGVLQAKPGLLEPIMVVEVRIPERYMCEVNRDLNGRRGRVLGMDLADGLQIINAHVPQAELFSYATELRSLTAGRGTFSAVLDHYEDVPSHLAEKIVETHRKEQHPEGH